MHLCDPCVILTRLAVKSVKFSLLNYYTVIYSVFIYYGMVLTYIYSPILYWIIVVELFLFCKIGAPNKNQGFVNLCLSYIIGMQSALLLLH